MRPLKLSYLLILVVSVLPLSDASGKDDLYLDHHLENVGSDEHKRTPNHIKATTDDKPEPPTPFQTETLKALRAIAKQEKTAYEQYRTDQNSWYSPTMVIEVALFLVAAVYTFFAWRTWQAIRRTVDIADTSLKLLQRAWLNTTFEKPFRLSETEEKFFFKIVNTGQLPGWIKIMAILGMRVEDKMPDIPLEAIPEGQLPTIAVVFPGDSLIMTYPVVGLSGNQIDAVNRGDKIWIVRAHVIYDDVFGVRHISRFCRQYIPPAADPTQSILRFPEDAKAEYNDAT